MNFPLALVPTIPTLDKLSTVTLHWNRPCPPDHSKMIPVADVLLPLLVRNIVLRKFMVLGAIGMISNAVVTKKTHDRPSRNRAMFLNIFFVPDVFISRDFPL